MPEPERQTGPKLARDPQALTSEYHKARKQLMLWAGILFIWELVGIDLEKAKEAGGNAGAIITSIRSPQAVPWALLILVAYFLFRFTVEWYQSNVSRRQMVVARIDFYSSWFISLLAITLYIGQSIRRVQFANLTGKFRLVAFVVPVLASVLAMLVYKQLSRPLERLAYWIV
jgi:hypothetical protein